MSIATRQTLERIIAVLAVIVIPIAVSVHTVIGWIFALTRFFPIVSIWEIPGRSGTASARHKIIGNIPQPFRIFPQ